jgi:hypothetical protein
MAVSGKILFDLGDGGRSINEKSVNFYENMCFCIPEVSDLHSHCYDNLMRKRHLNRHIDYKIKDKSILFHPFCVMMRCIRSKLTRHPKHLSWVTVVLKRILFSHRFWICCTFEIETRIQTCTLMEWVQHSKNSHTIILFFFLSKSCDMERYVFVF